MAITETAYAEAQAEIGRLRTALENQRRECDRAWREVEAIAKERDNHARGLASCRGDDDRLDEAERELSALRGQIARLRGALQPWVDSDGGRLWVWPESARETALRNSRDALGA